MTRTTALAAVMVVMLVSSLAWAGACPICLKLIPDGEQYCARHKEEALGKRGSSQNEKQLVDDVMRSRAAYVASLEKLRAHYTSLGHAEGMRKTEAMLRELREGTALAYQKWENVEALPDLNPAKSIPEAEALLKEADALRISLNPFNHRKRLRDAAGKYQEIILKYPDSTIVDSAAYGLGEVYSSGAVGEYRRGVRFFELCYLANQNTKHDAIYRAAQVCDSDLADYHEAARFYWMATTVGRSVYTRKAAAIRLKQLQKRGFGKSHIIDNDVPAEVTEETGTGGNAPVDK